MDMGELTTAEYDVTCRTDWCENVGCVIRITADASTPAIVCGPCSVAITDIVAVAVTQLL